MCGEERTCAGASEGRGSEDRRVATMAREGVRLAELGAARDEVGVGGARVAVVIQAGYALCESAVVWGCSDGVGVGWGDGSWPGGKTDFAVAEVDYAELGQELGGIA